MRRILLLAFLLTLGCEYEPIWETACLELEGDVLCEGTLDGLTMRVIAPSVFDAALDAGRYVEARPPQCEIDAFWDDVVCYTPEVSPNAMVCVGYSMGVLVPSSDPCAVAPAGYVDFYGLHVWPDPDDSDLEGAIDAPWPG